MYFPQYVPSIIIINHKGLFEQISEQARSAFMFHNLHDNANEAVTNVDAHFTNKTLTFSIMPTQTTPRFIIFFGGYVLLLCIAASMFLAIEQDVELEYIEHVNKLKHDFVKRYPCVQYDALEDLIDVFQVSIKKGLISTNNYTRWNFGQSLLFVSSIVTTIGYGHITPVSQSGKIFTILFALIGIPITLTLVSALVNRLLIPTGALLHWLNSKLEGTIRPFKIKLLHLMIILSIAVIFFLLVPAFIHIYLEPEWNYLDAVYYCFLSLTTIGFGDFTPGDTPMFFQHQSLLMIYKIGSTIYIFLGVTYMMLALAIFYDIPYFNLGDLYTLEAEEVSISTPEVEIHQESIMKPASSKKEVKIVE